MNKGEGTIKPELLPKILPCPFCGRDNSTHTDECYFTVSEGENDGDPIEAWNRRTPDTHALEVRVRELETAAIQLLATFDGGGAADEIAACQRMRAALHPQDSQEVGND